MIALVEDVNIIASVEPFVLERVNASVDLHYDSLMSGNVTRMAES